MSTPKGVKCQPRKLASGRQVLLYSDVDRIVLQFRHEIPTEVNLLEPSFKVAVLLTALEATKLAGDLLSVALPQLHTCRDTAGRKPEEAEQHDEEFR